MAGHQGAPRPVRRRSSWYHPIVLVRGLIARPRLYLAIIAAALTYHLLPTALTISARASVAWNVGAAVYLISVFILMSRCPAHTIRQRAEQEDESKFVFSVLILAAVASSFAAVIGLIGDATDATGMAKAAYMSLAGLTIFASWMVMQVVFTLHYAHNYYFPLPDGGEIARGLTFPEDDEPDYWDFFYFTTSIGASSQTSDVSITSKMLRRLVAVQAVLSFVFNTTVLAMAINLAAGLIQH